MLSSRKNPVIPLVLRRMRTPLLVLLTAYATAVLGFTLVPGVDDQGEPWRMSLFHAFYVVSYTGSTIGFGEVPYDFSNAQRMWTTVSIYLTVTAWLYAVGTLISLIRDPSFQAAVEHLRLQRSISHLREPFHLICGYGDTGSLLVRAFTERRRRVVVMDTSRDNIESLNLRELPVQVPALRLDPRNPEHLLAAGLRNRWCMSLLAVTDDDRANLKAAISSKLLRPGLTVIGRAESDEAADNMASFGTDHVVNPYDAFADRLHMTIRDPDMHRIYEWLSGVPNTELPERPQPPRGRWIICGHGRLGQAVHQRLRDLDIPVTVVDEDPEASDCPPNTVRGKGTEADTLREAGIADAGALMACTGDDADNLSVIMTARELRPEIFLVARENELANKMLFQAAEPDLVVEPSYIITSRVLSIVNTPLLGDFLAEAARRDAAWHGELAGRIRAVADGLVPESWTIRISQNRCPAVSEALKLGETVPVGSLLLDPARRTERLTCMPLLLVHEDGHTLLPDDDTPLASGDRVLFCGTLRAMRKMQRTLNNINTLRYILTGQARPDGLVWRRLTRHRGT